MGKAIAISIDKATTLRMDDKVQHYRLEETERVRALVEQLPPGSSEQPPSEEGPSEEAVELHQRLHILSVYSLTISQAGI